MSVTPKISVIMSVYNGEDYIEEAIESICNQTFKEWELIVINDCSTDNSSSIINKCALNDSRIKIHNNEVNLRLPKSLNKAISLASGKYIARMDADDISLPSRLEKQYKFMEENPDIALSSVRFMTIKNDVITSGGCGGRCDSDSIRAMLLFTNPILHPGVIAKAEVLKNLEYDTNVTCTEDLELWTRFSMGNYKMAILNEYLLLYRIHDKQITQTTLERQHNEVVKIQGIHYSSLLEAMSKEQEEFYITGIYFREKIDVDKFIRFYRFVKAKNKTKKIFKSEAIDYAAFEILAEYKRCGISKAELLRAMSHFNIFFLAKELLSRKKRAAEDGKRCMEAAQGFGLKHAGGSEKLPVFSR